MFFLDAPKKREFVIRTHMELELSEPPPFSVVDPLGKLAIVFPAGLPIPLKHRARAIGERTKKLSVAGPQGTDSTCQRERCYHSASQPRRRRRLHAPLLTSV